MEIEKIKLNLRANKFLNKGLVKLKATGIEIQLCENEFYRHEFVQGDGKGSFYKTLDSLGLNIKLKEVSEEPIELIDFKEEYPIFGGINFLRVRENGESIHIVESYINFDGWRNANEIAGELLEKKIEIEIANHFSQGKQVKERLVHLFRGNYPFSDCSECGAAAFIVAKYFNEKDRIKHSLGAYCLEDQIEDLYQHLKKRCA